jgi:hypothetical protein
VRRSGNLALHTQDADGAAKGLRRAPDEAKEARGLVAAAQGSVAWESSVQAADDEELDV